MKLNPEHVTGMTRQGHLLFSASPNVRRISKYNKMPRPGQTQQRHSGGCLDYLENRESKEQALQVIFQT